MALPYVYPLSVIHIKVRGAIVEIDKSFADLNAMKSSKHCTEP